MTKHAGEGNGAVSLGFDIFQREREWLLSKIPGNRTVGFHRIKKESCSTRRGLRAGTGLRSFDKLCEVGVLSYLFYTLFKCFVMLELI